MKQNRTGILALTVILLLTLVLSTATACQAPSGDTSDPSDSGDAAGESTAIPEAALTIDQNYRIVIAADASELTRATAEKMAAAFKEKAGLELAVVSDAEPPAEHELVLGHTNRRGYAVVTDYTLTRDGSSLYLDAAGSATLSSAVDAVLETWLTPDFGLTKEGVVTLAESRVKDLNGLSHRMSTSIRVMTQNMRGDNDPDGNTIPKRYERFIQLLADYQPDVIGTQEHTFSWYQRFLKLFDDMADGTNIPHYGLVGESCDGPDKKGGGRNVIFYRTDRFDLLETGTFWLSETPDTPSSMTAGTQRRVCTWALLKDKRSEETILVVNTHLDHTREEIRVSQIQVVLDFISEKAGDHPVFFTGDFNAGSRSDTYGLVSETFSDSRNTAEQNLSTVTGTFHGYHEGGRGSVIDYVFHDGRSTPVTYEILSKSYGGFVSDHYGVLVDFALK